jgi:DNA-binding NarL/FixJ family response regulator
MKLRIFLIEDHEWTREALASLIDMEGDLAICGTAASAEEALVTMPAHIDLILVDYHLPGMTGTELVRILMERHPDLLCIVYTGWSEYEITSEAMAAGACAVVEKGDAPALVAAVYEAFDRMQS